MGFFRSMGKVIKPMVNFPRWMGWNQIADSGKFINSLAKDVFKTKPDGKLRDEKFEDACRRLNLTSGILLQRQKHFLRYAIFFVCLSFALFAYGIYLLIFGGFFMAFLICLSLTCVSLSLAFREHFWYIQIRHRRLGISLKDWFKLSLHQPVGNGEK